MFRTIVVSVDGSSLTERALAYVVRSAVPIEGGHDTHA